MKKQPLEAASSAELAGFTLIELTTSLAITVAMLSGSVAALARLLVGR